MDEQLYDNEQMKRCRYMLSQMYSERSKYEARWRKFSEYIFPMRGRFHEENGSREGERRDMKMWDTYPIGALQKCAAGLASGLSSPSRPWFKLSLQDEEKANYHTVRVWLDDVHDIMMGVYAKGNTYQMLYELYAEMCLFGTGAALSYEDYETAVWHRPFTCGEYAGGVDSKGRVSHFGRRMEMNAMQMVQHFGKENVSTAVLNAYERRNMTERFGVEMLIEKNLEYDREKLALGNFPWRSWYWETGRSERFLRISGYYEQPFLMPRWLVIANGTYGYGQGDASIGNCMQLQKLESNKLKCTDNEADPAMMFPASAKGVSTKAGAKNFIPDNTQLQAYPLVPPGAKRYEGMVMLVTEKRQQISADFYNDLMAMLTTMQPGSAEMTAREIAERHEEKMLMLSPVLEKVFGEALTPLTMRTFGICLRNELLPPMPDELSEEDIKVEFVSILAQAQKMVEMPAVEKVIGLAGNFAAVKPDIVDNIDFDKALRRTAEIYGAPESILRSEEEVAELRQQRAELQQEQEQKQTAAIDAETAKKTADAARLLAEVPTNGANALNELLGGAV